MTNPWMKCKNLRVTRTFEVMETPEVIKNNEVNGINEKPSVNEQQEQPVTPTVPEAVVRDQKAAQPLTFTLDTTRVIVVFSC